MNVYAASKLLKTIKKCRLSIDTDIIKLALDYAETAHKGQLRATGEPFINHSIATATTLADMGMDESTVLAGILHDIHEDTLCTLEDIEKNFGKDVARLVEGVSKLGRVKYRGVERYIESLRKMFIAMAEDIRVIMIKFADRIHNLQTLYAHPPHKRKRIAVETLEIYAPIANRLGMEKIKSELEDLSFQYAYPEEYAWLQAQTVERYHEAERHLKIIKKQLEKELQHTNVKYLAVEGRGKNLFRLYKKVLQHNRDIGKVHDLIALRIIVETVPQCYTVLGIIHRRWTPIKGRIKDYIAQPKPNGYQSLHTSAFCDHGEIVEFQIRTKEMHEEAEHGIAAHWRYDESDIKRVSKKLAWVEELRKWKEDIKDNEKYLERLKIDVFQNRIFVFTPKGDVIDLPEGATPVDFAYHVHSDIGNKMTGARINGNIASLKTILKSGDVCEIIVDKKRRGPNLDWLSFVKTNTARGHIRNSRRSILSLPSILEFAKKGRFKNKR